MKTDADGCVRKVTVKYKLTHAADDGVAYKASPYKYAERNVRGLALVMTAQERNDVENIDLDAVRFDKKVDEEIDNSGQNDENKREDEQEASVFNEEREIETDQEVSNPNDEENSNIEASENILEKENPNPENLARLLPPSSRGRIRRKPKKLDL